MFFKVNANKLTIISDNEGLQHTVDCTDGLWRHIKTINNSSAVELIFIDGKELDGYGSIVVPKEVVKKQPVTIVVFAVMHKFSHEVIAIKSCKECAETICKEQEEGSYIVQQLTGRI